MSASTDTSDVAYHAYVDFTPNDEVRLGMTVVATPETGTADSTAVTETTNADQTQSADAATRARGNR